MWIAVVQIAMSLKHEREATLPNLIKRRWRLYRDLKVVNKLKYKEKVRQVLQRIKEYIAARLL